MKVQVRQGCFETNSSSTHAICINTKGVLNMPPKTEMVHGREQKTQLRAEGKYCFGWDVERYHDIEHKLDYLWQAIVYTYSSYADIIGYEDEYKCCPIYKEYDLDSKLRMIIAAKKKVEQWLDEEGYWTYLVNPKVSIMSKYSDGDSTDYYSYIDLDTKQRDFSSYIDHGDETREFVEGVLSDKSIFMAYLFCDDSCICTGNDNDGPIDYPSNDTFDLKYYKGN